MRRLLSTLLLGAAFATSAFAGTNPHITAHPSARITAKVDAKAVVQLTGTVPGKIARATDLGRASSTQQMSQLHLVLKSSDEQLAALETLLSQQQDKNSENFHQWMTPDTFAASFGIDASDVAKVSDWLSASGLTVNKVNLGGRVITFSGSVAGIEKAFGTEMHNFKVDGETHLANVKEVSIPSALATVVTGPARLDDFPFKKPAATAKKVVKVNGKWFHVLPNTKNQPDFTSPYNGNHFLAPGDFDTVYNTTALYAAGTTGKGIKIGIVGQTQVDLADTQIFRSIFGLPPNDPILTNGGNGVQVDPDDIESDLDIQWSGAVAPFATVYFNPVGYGAFTGGIDSSTLNYIEQNVVDIISLSYGGCEASDGSTESAFYNGMWAEAAAQGQSVFVSAGDSSATGCVSSGTEVATRAAYGVNSLGSSAYNVAVGGTMFNEGGYINGLQTGQTSYWGPANSGPPFSSALQYIPESVMSDGAFNQVLGGAEAEAEGNPGVFGGGGGVSQFVARPPWQVGVGISATADPTGPTFTASGALKTGLHRLVPDVSLQGSLSHDDTMMCYEGSCVLDQYGDLVEAGLVGGTSVAAPSWAGVMALIDQANGGRQGNPNFYFYKLAAAEPSITACASLGSPAPASTCNFHDIVTGDNYSPLTTKGLYVPPVLNSGGTAIVTPGFIQGTLGTDYIGFPATTGFDEASGLGSPNVGNIVKNWATVAFNSTTTTLTATPTTQVHGKAVAVTIAVTAPGGGTPTGTVSITEPGINGGAPIPLTLTAAGTYTGNVVSLPGGTYNIYAVYSGDGTYAASTSAPVSITITKEASIVEPSVGYFSTSTGALTTPRGNAYTYGQIIEVASEIVGASATSLNAANAPNTGTPTGTVTYAPTYTPTGGTATALTPATINLDQTGIAYLNIGSFPADYVYSNYPGAPLNVGTYSILQTYSGDNSFLTGTATSPFTVGKATSTPTLTINTPDVAVGADGTVTVTVAPIYGSVDVFGNLVQTGAYPTGTITLTDSAAPTALGTGTLVNGVAVITTPGLTTAGANTLTATYAGDTNYAAAASKTGTITVTAGTASGVTLSVTPGTGTAIVLGLETLTATVPTGATGTVSFFDNGSYLGRANVSGTTATYASDAFTAGLHNFTAEYSGNATITSGTSAVVAVTIAKNAPYMYLNNPANNVAGASVALQATFNPSPYFTEATGAPVPPTGVISFYDGSTLIGTAPLVYGINFEQYTATFSTVPSTGVTHNYYATYPGDANYLPIGPTSSSEPVTTAATGVTYAFNPSSLFLPQGQAGVPNLVITANNYWAGTVSITCSSPQQNTYCNLGATSVTFSGLINTGFMVAKTLPISVVTVAPTPPVFAGLMWIPAVFFAGFLIIRRKHLSGRVRKLLTIAVMFCGVTALSGCSAAVNRTGVENGTPVGTYNVIVTATATGTTSASPSGVTTVVLPVTVSPGV